MKTQTDVEEMYNELYLQVYAELVRSGVYSNSFTSETQALKAAADRAHRVAREGVNGYRPKGDSDGL